MGAALADRLEAIPGDVPYRCPRRTRKPQIHGAQTAKVVAPAGSPPETIHTDMIRAAFSTRAAIAIAPMQDFLGLGSEARLNVPGTTGNNWRWRVLDAQITDGLCDNVAAMVEASGRAPPG